MFAFVAIRSGSFGGTEFGKDVTHGVLLALKPRSKGRQHPYVITHCHYRDRFVSDGLAWASIILPSLLK